MPRIREQFNLNTVVSLMLTTTMAIVGYFANRTLIQIDARLASIEQKAEVDHDRIAVIEAAIGIGPIGRRPPVPTVPAKP